MIGSSVTGLVSYTCEAEVVAVLIKREQRRKQSTLIRETEGEYERMSRDWAGDISSDNMWESIRFER